MTDDAREPLPRNPSSSSIRGLKRKGNEFRGEHRIQRSTVSACARARHFRRRPSPPLFVIVINVKETFKCFCSLSTVIRLTRRGGRLWPVPACGWMKDGGGCVLEDGGIKYNRKTSRGTRSRSLSPVSLWTKDKTTWPSLFRVRVSRQ